MSSGWWSRLALVVAVLVWGAVSLIPAVANWEEGACPGWYPASMCSRISLGLDLQGGVHLVLGIDIDGAIKDKVEVLGQSMARDFGDKEEGKQVTVATLPGRDYGLSLTFASEGDREAFETSVLTQYPNFQTVSSSGSLIEVDLRPEYVSDLDRSIQEQTIKTLENRVNEFGVKESSISKWGEGRILVELPGVKNDPKEVERRFGKAARLEFKIVDDAATFLASQAANLPAGVTVKYEGGSPYLESADRTLLEGVLANRESLGVPENLEVLVGDGGSERDVKLYRTYTLEKTVLLTGDSIADAGVAQDPQNGRPYVTVVFDNTGARTFADLTERNTKRRMAIVLDDFVSSAPVIQERIGGGRASITLGSLTGFDELLRDAQELAAVLRAGALPADVEILFRREVGASLGQDLIESGMRSIIIGAALVLLTMAVYYGLAGLFADIAVLMNLVMILALMAAFGATLTLPGMAGLVLTLGMAVDANVIINERIRDELRAGKTVRAAVTAGYDKAFSAIFDSNLTTVIAGVILYQFGTGPVRGFAVTLSIGVMCSMFTAIVVTRLLSDLMVDGFKVKKFSV